MDDWRSRTIGTTAAPASERYHPGEVMHDRLVVALEADRPLAGACCYSLADVETVYIGRGRTRRMELVDGVLTVQIPDRVMSSKHAELKRGFAGWQVRDRGSRNGCFVAGQRVTGKQPWPPGRILELGHTFFLIAPGAVEDAAVERDPPPGTATFHGSLGQELSQARRLAQTPVSFVLHGESGTGKELLARALHHWSSRSGQFVAINCGAIPETLIGSELFGHKKGSFSGAVADRVGLIRNADGGTLFLDEIADLPLAAQAALLRVLQERKVRPIGEQRSYPVDIQLLCATYKDLQALVEAEQFRPDLYARIAGIVLRLPPLRQRRMDLGLLIAALLPKVAPSVTRPRFTVKAANALFQYRWPMNIRELETCLMTAAALAGDQPIDYRHLPASVRQGLEQQDAPEKAAVSPAPTSDRDASSRAGSEADGSEKPARRTRPKVKIEVTRAEVEAALAEHDDNVSLAARALGISRQALYRRIQQFGIVRGSSDPARPSE